MINTTALFTLDDSISLVCNELYELKNEIQKIVNEDNNFQNNQYLSRLILKRDLLYKRILNLEKQREKY